MTGTMAKGMVKGAPLKFNRHRQYPSSDHGEREKTYMRHRYIADL